MVSMKGRKGRHGAECGGGFKGLLIAFTFSLSKREEAEREIFKQSSPCLILDLLHPHLAKKEKMKVREMEKATTGYR
jgi:hypothetical protein